ncbi:sodium-dependent transporter [Marinospirillum sp.]|uniref:sodium-dependent transporter n=1 Tax=Marinospirillum sp. TaxID=2183934 RepID=UPI003A8A5F90
MNHPVLEAWSSNRAFIFAVTGAAVGLGNIWRFPYLTGENGGSVFLLLYLFFMLVIGLPIMIAEIGLGRAGRAGPMQALMRLAQGAGASLRWRYLAVFGGLTLFLILSFYSMVSGWSLAYLVKSVDGSLAQQSPEVIAGAFGQLMSNPVLMLLCHTLFLLLTLGVVAAGVNQGLERLNTYLMPLLYLLLLLLAAYAVTTPGFAEAMRYLFLPDFNAVSWKVVLDAMGQAFFTLAVGACALMAYGAYMPEDQSLPRAAVVVALLDVGVALLAGIAIFALVFSHQLEPTSGPGLMFITLPIAFSELPFSHVLSLGFFLLLLLATWTSSINLAEPLVAMLKDRGWSRLRGTAVIGLGVWILGSLAALSFNVMAEVYPLGFLGGVFAEKNLFGLLTSIPTDIFLPLGGLLIAIFAVYIVPVADIRAAIGGSETFYLLWRRMTAKLAIPLTGLLLLTSVLTFWGVL